MNILDMHIAVRNELDKTEDFQYPDFLPEQIDYWLNKSYDLEIEEIAYPTTQNKIPFEVTQKRIDELSDIVKPITLTTTQSQTNFLTQLPNDYKHLVRHECKTVKGSKESRVSGIITNNDKINLQKKNPFWKPISTEPLYYLIEDKIIYETFGDFKVEESYLTYIKTTPKMQLGSEYTIPTEDIDCSINNITVQYRIINRAVSMMLENIESPRYQTNLNEFNKTN